MVLTAGSTSIRPIALAHISMVDASAIWEVTVGTYDWRDAAEEWALHRWIRENGAADGEMVLVRLEEFSNKIEHKPV